MKKIIRLNSQDSSKKQSPIGVPSTIMVYQMCRIFLIPLILIFIAFEQSGPIHSLLEIVNSSQTTSFLIVIATILAIAGLGHLAARHVIDRLADPLLFQPVAFEGTYDEPPPMYGDSI